MFRLRRQPVSLAAIVLALCGLVPTLNALHCRSGTEGGGVQSYQTNICLQSNPACFQSVLCWKSGGVDVKQYQWSCIDKGICSALNGSNYAHHLGIKGMSRIPVYCIEAGFILRCIQCSKLLNDWKELRSIDQCTGYLQYGMGNIITG